MIVNAEITCIFMDKELTVDIASICGSKTKMERSSGKKH